jgi:hypothetical protein
VAALWLELTTKQFGSGEWPIGRNGHQLEGNGLLHAELVGFRVLHDHPVLAQLADCSRPEH